MVVSTVLVLIRFPLVVCLLPHQPPFVEAMVESS